MWMHPVGLDYPGKKKDPWRIRANQTEKSLVLEKENATWPHIDAVKIY
jgi:hypothetical protein